MKTPLNSAPRSLYGEHPAGGRVIAVLTLTALLVLTQLYAAIPLTGTVSAELGADVTFALSTVFALCYAAGFLFWGPLSDHYGRRRIMLIGLVGITAVTLGCGLVSSVPALAVLRAAQGFMAASFAPVALAYLTEATSPRLRPVAIGALSTAFLTAGIAGQVLAAALSLTLGWTWVFLTTGAALGLCLLGVARLVTEPEREPGTHSLARRFTAVGRVAASPAVLLLCVGHVTLLLSFVAMYTGLGNHLSDLGLDTSHVMWLRLVALPGMFVSLVTGMLARRIGMAAVARTGYGLAAAALLAQAALSGTLAGTALSSLVFVIGVALAIPAMIHLFGESAAPNRAGGMALNGFVLFLGASAGPLAANLGLSFPMLLVGLSALLAITVLCLTGYGRLRARTDAGSAA